MNYKKDWWKYLGILIMLYVLFMGFKIPIKPGILDFTNSDAKTGEIFQTEVFTYNTNLNTATDLNVWLWLPDDKLLKAEEVIVKSHTHLAATFNIPSYLEFSTDQGNWAKILIDNVEEGYYFIRNAVNIKKGESLAFNKEALYDLSEIKQTDLFAYPFQHNLYETIRNTFFHVAIWMAMFMLLLISCFYSILYLIKKNHDYDKQSSSLTSAAIVFGIAGLLTGSMWAKYTWGAFWTDDIKLNMTAVALLIYLGYWILRSSLSDIDAKARLSSVFNLFAFVCLMILVMVIPRLTASLHPGNGGNPAFSNYDLDNTLRAVFYPAIIGYILIGLWIAQLNYRFLKIKEQIDFGD